MFLFILFLLTPALVGGLVLSLRAGPKVQEANCVFQILWSFVIGTYWLFHGLWFVTPLAFAIGVLNAISYHYWLQVRRGKDDR